MEAGRCASVAGGAGWRSAAGHAAKAGTNTSGAGGLYPSDACGLAESVEDFAVEQLVAQASVEALDVPVLPGAADWPPLSGPGGMLV